LFDGSDDPLFRLRKLRMSDPGQKKEDGGAGDGSLSMVVRPSRRLDQRAPDDILNDFVAAVVGGEGS